MRTARWRTSALAVTLILIMTACGASGGGAAQVSDTGAGQSSDADAPATTPADPAGSDALEDRTIGWVDCCLSGSYQERLYLVAEEAIEHIGWELQTVDTQADPAKAASGVSSLVASDVDAIIMSAITPSTARAGLLEAKAAGIPVLVVGSAVDDSLNEELGLVYIGEDEYGLTEPLAELMLQDLGSGDSVAMITTTALASAVQRTEALTEALEDAGVDVVAALETGFDFTAGQESASTLLNQHKDLASIISIYDLWTAATVSAIKAADREEVKVYSYYADAVNNPLMRDNPDIVLGLADGDMITAPLLALDKLLAYFTDGTPIDASGSEEYSYVAITSDTLPPGEQNGPVSPEEALAPFYEEWSQEYGIAE